MEQEIGHCGECGLARELLPCGVCESCYIREAREYERREAEYCGEHIPVDPE